MKSATKHIVISTILCALTLVVFLAFYNRLPASIPVHFDSAGVANSFWPRNVVVFCVPVACVLLNLISGFTVRQKENAKVKKHLRLLLSEKEGEEKLAFYRKKNQKARARLLEALLADRLLDYELVTGKLNITLPVIRALEEQGVLKLESEQIYRNPVQQGTQQPVEGISGPPHGPGSGFSKYRPVWWP